MAQELKIRDDLSRMESTLRTDVLALLALAQASRDSSARDSTARAAQPAVRAGGAALDSVVVRQLAREVRALFPEVEGVVWSPIPNLLAPDSVATLPTLFLEFTRRASASTQRDIVPRVEALARMRLRTDRVLVRGR